MKIHRDRRSEEVRAAKGQILAACKPGGHGDHLHSIGLCCADIIHMITDQCHPAAPFDPPFPNRRFHGNSHQFRARSGHFSKGAEAKMVFQTGMLHLLPSDPSQVACYESHWYSLPPKPRQQRPHAGTDLRSQIGTTPHIAMLRLKHNIAHRLQNQILGGAGIGEHPLKDVAVKHALRRNVVGASVDAGNSPDSLDERIAMPPAGPSDERTVDIKQHKSRRGRGMHI